MAVDLQRAAVNTKDCFSGLVDRRKDRVVQFLDSVEYKEAWRSTQCSSSQPLTPSNWPKLAHSHQALKEHTRNGVGPAVRKQLWIGVAEVTDDDSVLFAKAFGEPADAVSDEPEQIHMMYGFPFDLDCLPLYCMKPVFDAAFGRVLMAVAYTHPHITVSPLLPVLVRVMLHFLDEWECYAVLFHLLRKQAGVEKDMREVLTSQATFRSLCHTHARSSLPDLMKLKPGGMSDESFLAQLTRHWYMWPFYKQPFWITVRVLDLYMVEGPKILYRLGLSAIKLFASHMQPVAIAAGDIEEAVQQFTCGVSAQQRSQWFQGAFSIPRLPWNTILRQWTAYLSKIPEGQVDMVDGPLPLLPGYKRSVDPDLSSEILSSEELWQAVWGWLPDWVTTEQTECVFRASRDGYNLRTLYRKCEDLQALVLLVKTTQGEVFGAFIASDLNERHGSQFFGTGETFLFSLLPAVHCYHWSGETDLILRGNDSELAVGSGGGAYGLWLDGELDKGVTSTCLAFHNNPLTGSDTQFSCTAIEAYTCV